MKTATSAFMVYLIALSIICLFAIRSAHADDTITWAAPTQASDGSALALQQITGFTVYTGQTNVGPFTTKLFATNVNTATQYINPNPAPGNNCYVVTASDAKGESSQSNVACKNTPFPPATVVPSAPVITSVK